MSIHERLSQLATEHATLDWEEGRWLLRAARRHVHVYLGIGSFAEYVERLFGYKPRSTEEKLRVAAALEELPELTEQLRGGALNWSAVRELTRVATSETEQRWISAARGKSVREVEQLVAGRARGDTPEAAPRPELRRHALAFEVNGETLALFREALAQLRRESGEALDDDAALLLMARRVLGGPSDDGRASFQIAIDVCQTCARAVQRGKGDAIPVAPEILEMAKCDAQHVGAARPDAHVGAAVCETSRAAQDVSPATRRTVLRRDGQRCVVPGCKNAVFLDVHHLRPRSAGGGHDPDNLVALCGAHHRAQHRGQLVIEGRPSTGLVIRRADGAHYGELGAAANVDVHARVFRALRGMGFGEAEVRRAMVEVRARAGLANSGIEHLLRAALQAIAPHRPGTRRSE